ncbi:MAG: BACON domain-containing protein [Alistipes sp.]|nr:BACON domain-containing protein [Alistipes sp.]
MLKFLRPLHLLVVALASLFVACELVAVESGELPTMELDTYQLSVTGEGGNITIFYGVTNPIKGEKPQVSSNVEWIVPGEVGGGKIMLHVAESDSSEERMGFVTVSYKNMEKPLRVYVTQDKQPLNDFKFSVSDVTYKSCKVHYSPRNQQRPYMANIIDSEYFKQTGITDGTVFVANEMESYLALAQRHNMTLEELMQNVSPQLIYSGEAVREFVGMQPGATYTIYSYGVEFHGNSYTMTTPLHTSIVDIPMPAMYDVNFQVTATMSNGSATISVTPENWNGYYAVQIAPEDNLLYIPQGETLSEYAVKSIASNFYTSARNAMKSGYSAEQYLKANCYSGYRSINMQLQSGKKYMIIVFAVESKDGEVPVMRSMPVVRYL